MKTFERQEIVKGAGFFVGEQGTEFAGVSSGSVFIEENMEQGETLKGSRTVEYKADAEVIKRTMHNEFPLTAIVSYGMKVTRKKQEMIVVDVKPISRANGQPAAAQAAPAK